MKTEWDKKVEKMRETARRRMNIVPAKPEVIAHFDEEKIAYALVEQKAARDKKYEQGLVPLIPRHMNSANWRHLFWLGVTKISVGGKSYNELCTACSHRIICMQEGLGKEQHFECRASRETLNFDVASRTWREKKNGRRRSKPLGNSTFAVRAPRRSSASRDVRSEEHGEAGSGSRDHHEPGTEEA